MVYFQVNKASYYNPYIQNNNCRPGRWNTWKKYVWVLPLGPGLAVLLLQHRLGPRQQWMHYCFEHHSGFCHLEGENQMHRKATNIIFQPANFHNLNHERAFKIILRVLIGACVFYNGTVFYIFHKKNPGNLMFFSYHPYYYVERSSLPLQT